MGKAAAVASAACRWAPCLPAKSSSVAPRHLQPHCTQHPYKSQAEAFANPGGVRGSQVCSASGHRSPLRSDMGGKFFPTLSYLQGK